MTKRRVFLETNGCLSRSLDLRRMKDYFEKNDCQIVQSAANADDIVFLGCAAVKQEEDWSLERINDLKKNKGRLIVGGCVKEIAGDRFPAALKPTAINTRNIADIDLFFPDFKGKFKEIPDANEAMFRNLRHYFRNNVLNVKEFRLCYIGKLIQYYHTRFAKSFVIRIGTGCEEKCTFCAIWRAIGPNTSKPIEECLRELKIATDRGIHRINLVADHLGAYGTDVGTSLAELLEAMIKQDPDIVFILEELHPKWFMKYQDTFYRLIAENKIFSLHIPLQSGSDEVLKRMNRKHKISEIYEPLLRIKQLNPRVKLYTDIIVGFPSETEDDFERSLSVVKTVGFDSIAYYEYDSKYAHPQFQQLPKEVVKNRVNRLASFLWQNRIGGAPF